MVSTIIKSIRSRTPEEFVNDVLLPRIKNPVVFADEPLKPGGESVDVIRFACKGKRLMLGFRRFQKSVERGKNRFGRPYATINNIPVLPLSESAWPAISELVTAVSHKEGGGKSLHHAIPIEMLWENSRIQTEKGLRIAEVDLGEKEFNELGRYYSEAHGFKAYHEAIQYLIRRKNALSEEIALRRLVANAHLGNAKSLRQAVQRVRWLLNNRRTVVQELDNAANKEEARAALKKTGLPAGFLEHHAGVLSKALNAARKAGVKQKVSKWLWP